MKVTQQLQKAKSTLFTFEILPPLKGHGIQEIFDAIDLLMDFNPPFIDVTYHRQDFIYVELPDGKIEKRPHRKRPGTVGICAAIINRYKIDPVPHIICGGFSRQDTEDALLDLDYLGIDNVLVIQGDKRRNDKSFEPEVNGNRYASELLEQIMDMNKGNYLDPDLVVKTPLNFCAGVACYPEKHSEAPNMETDIHYLKIKQNLGAEYAVTQMFFDNKKYFQFLQKCKEAGITIPIIPGLKPITGIKQLTMLPRDFSIDIPEELTRELLKAKSPEAVRQVGEEWCTAQCKELIQQKVPCLHFYTMGKAHPVKNIVERLI